MNKFYRAVSSALVVGASAVVTAPAIAQDAPPSTAPAVETRRTPVKKAKTWKVGDAVKARWHNKWTPGKIVRFDGPERILVRWDNWSDFHNSWVTRADLLEPGAEEPDPHAEFLEQARKRREAMVGASPKPGAPGTSTPGSVGQTSDAGISGTPTEEGVVAVDLSEMREIAPGEPPASWTLVPDAAPEVAYTNMPVLLQGGQGQFFEAVRNVAVRMPYAVASHVDAPPGRDETIRIERVNLITGKSMGWASAPSKTRAVTISPDGKRVILQSDEFMPGTKGRLSLATVDGNRLKVDMSFRPYSYEGEPSPGRETDVISAHFIDDDHLLTTSEQGRAILWNLSGKSPKARYTLQVQRSTSPVISPGGKYFACKFERRVHIHDVRTGELLARLGDEDGAATTISKMEFSEDGTRVGGLGSGECYVWDMATGKLLHQVAVPPGHSPEGLELIGQRYALVGHDILLDLEKKLPIWKYDLAGVTHLDDRLLGVAGGRVWFAMQGETKDSVVTGVTLPHKAAVAEAERLPPSEERMLLMPGKVVSLEVRLSGVAAESKEVEQHLRSQLERLGVTIEPNQPIKLVATLTQGAGETATYETTGPRFGPFATGGKQTTVTTKSWKQRVALEVDKQVAWEVTGTSGGIAPGMLHAERGKSFQQDADMWNDPNIGFFMSVKLPKYVLMPRQLQSSRLTARGVE